MYKECQYHQIKSSLDRWQECHWYIHQMEKYYHYPEEFRYSLNAFIRAIKEIPQILQMELQNNSVYQIKLKPIIGLFKENKLFET